MKVQEIFRMDFNESFEFLKLDGGIVFTNGVTIYDYHEQDCCESVYCDFNQVENLFKTQKFNSLVIEGVEGCGIKVNGYFIPCYNEQNGYYSSDLELQIEIGRKHINLNISDFVEDNIY